MSSSCYNKYNKNINLYNPLRGACLVTGKNMRALTLFVISLALFPWGISLAQSWIKYVNETDQFIINFPHEPEVREISYVSEHGATIPTRVYTVEDSPAYYSVTVVDYSGLESANEELSARTGSNYNPLRVQGELSGAIAYAAWNIRRRGGEITYDAWSSMDGVPGHQLQITNEDQLRTFVAIHRLDRLLYILEGTVPENSIPPIHFQQSLGFLDEQGKRVSVEYDEQGQRTRVKASYEWIGTEDPETGEIQSE